jgi:hypothetical protein
MMSSSCANGFANCQRAGRNASARVSLLIVAGCLLVARPARAELFLVPWVGGGTGAQPSGSVGASFGASLAEVFDVDADLGYSPSYSVNGSGGSLIMTLADVTVGIPLKRAGATRLRPYVTAGAGVVRMRVDIAGGYQMVRDDFVTAFGGGLTAFADEHVGVRADLRRIDNRGEPASPTAWRWSVGIVFK